MIGYIGLVLTGVFLGLPPDKTAPDSKRVEELVQRLGDRSFRVRDAAYRELISIGTPAKSALEKGLKDPDLDVSESCRRLLPQIRESYVHEQIDLFLANPKESAPADLPGLKRWMEMAGDSKASRTMYAEVVLQYHVMIGEADANGKMTPDTSKVSPVKIGEADTNRGAEKFYSFCKEIYNRRYQRMNGGIRMVTDDISPLEVELFLFLASHPNIRTPAAPDRRWLTLGTSSIFASAAMRKVLSEEGTMIPARKLFLGWLENETYQMSAAYRIAMDLQIREAAPIALKMVKDVKQVASYRSVACLALGKLGTPEHLKEVAALAKDDTEVGPAFFFNNNGVLAAGQSMVLLGDVAMATVLNSSKQKLSDFGYDIPENRNFGNFAIPNYYGFHTDENRKEAREKFAKWWAEEQKK